MSKVFKKVTDSIFGSPDKVSSTTRPGPASAEELELQQLAIEISQQQLEEIKRQSSIQQEQFTALQPLIDEQIRFEQLQFDQLQQQMEFQDELAPMQQELVRRELEAIEQGTEATDEQKALIAQITEEGIAAGEVDIDRFSEEGLERLRSQLAPSLGLRPGDSPILDRGARVQAEALRQKGLLSSGFRGAQAQAELNFPIAAGQFQAARTQAQQGLGMARNEFLNSLQQQIVGNRLNQQGLQMQGGLGLLGIPFTGGGALSSIAGTRGSSTKQRGGDSGKLGALGGFFSSIGSLGGM